MNEQLTYRDDLINTLSGLENTLKILGGLALSLVFFEDKQNNCYPFETGDDIPFSLDLVYASDIPSARILGDVMKEIEDVHAHLCNINSLSSDDFTYVELSEEEKLTYNGNFPLGRRNTLDDLKNEAADYVSYSMAFLMEDCYLMKYGYNVPEGDGNDFYFPTDDTFELFASDDVNIKRLVELARFLLEKRDEAWEEV